MKNSLVFGLCALSAVGAASGWFPGPAWAADPLNQALETAAQSNLESAQSQERIDTLATGTQSMIDEYRQVTAQAGDLKAYNDQAERLLASQKAELEGLKNRTATGQVTQQNLVPLLRRMVETLEKFVQLDTPFLAEERHARVQELKLLLDQPDVSMTEKYRRVMEAYQVEAEYGRTIEAYTAPLDQGGTAAAQTGSGNKAPTVNFLRVGRMMLLYASLDGTTSGHWDQTSRTFKPLPVEFNREIEHGLQIARKEAAPDLLKVPLPAPEAVR